MPIGPTSGFLDFTNATPRADVIIALSNIGVGTDVPLHALDIRGTANVADIIINNDLTLIGGLTTNTLTINSVSMSTTSNFQQVTNVGNATTNTVQFTNPTTGFAVSSNASVGGELSVSGNAEVGTANLFVDTVSGNVGIGMTDPGHNLDIVSEMNLRSVSNTASIKYNSNVVTEYTRSKKFIKYPRVLLPYDAQDSQGGYENYIVDQSSVYTSESDHGAYLSFRNVGNYWLSSSNSFDGGDDVFNGTNGPWISIQLPNKIKLEYLEFYHRSGITNQKVTAGSVYASNDGTNWTEIGSLSGLGTYDTTSVPARVNFTHTTLYDRYLLHVTANQTNYVSMERLSFYGIPEYDPEARGTDVIMRSVPNVPNTDWLEVYWDAGNTSSYSGSGTTVTDLSGNGVTGTITGTNGFDSTYNAWEFDGTGDYISSTHPLGTGAPAHSISFWFKNTEANPSYRYIAALGGAGYGNQSSFRLTGTRLEYGKRDYTINAPNAVPNNVWVHAVSTFTGGTFSEDNIFLYVNGVNAEEFPGYYKSEMANQTGTTLNIVDDELYLGSATNSTGGFQGYIANYRLFNRALTADEVWQLYAYQKEYFDVSPDVVTFKGGRLGIGTSEPRAVLDVRGDFHAHGSVVQFQNRTFGLSFSTTSTTFTDTGAYVDITPKFSNSKFFVMFDGLAYIGTNLANGLGIRGYRSIGGGADQLVYAASQYEGAIGSPHDLALYLDPANYMHGRIPISFGDTPNTSSSITYKIYARAHVSGRNARLGNSGHQPVTFSVFEIAQ